MKRAFFRVLEETFPMLAVIIMVLLVLLAALEPIIPSEEDCIASGRPSDCWRETKGRSK